VVAPVLQVLPVTALDVSSTLPPAQNVVGPTAVITGADGMGLGIAEPLTAALVQPFTVCLTLYDPVFVTVIEGVVCPLLHNNVPL